MCEAGLEAVWIPILLDGKRVAGRPSREAAHRERGHNWGCKRISEYLYIRLKFKTKVMQANNEYSIPIKFLFPWKFAACVKKRDQ